MSRQSFILAHSEARRNAMAAVADAPMGYSVEVRPATRTLSQNARMWAQLGDISRQVVWHGRKLDPEAWKHIFTASLRRLDVVPNLDGTGFVALGMSTSGMSKRELSDLTELMTAFGEEHGVRWSEPGFYRDEPQEATA